MPQQQLFMLKSREADYARPTKTTPYAPLENCHAPAHTLPWPSQSTAQSRNALHDFRLSFVWRAIQTIQNKSCGAESTGCERMLLTWVEQTEASLKRMRDENTPGVHQVRTTPWYSNRTHSTYGQTINRYEILYYRMPIKPLPQDTNEKTRPFQVTGATPNQG